jgi:hypothetical protein
MLILLFLANEIRGDVELFTWPSLSNFSTINLCYCFIQIFSKGLGKLCGCPGFNVQHQKEKKFSKIT